MIVGTLLVRNEADIVRENLLHHLKEGVDSFIVTNHRSEDKTLEILREFKEIVELIDEQGEGYHHGKFQTRMARVAHKMGASWVVPLDGDEFWYGVKELRGVDAGVARMSHYFKHFPTPQVTMEGFSRSQMPYFSKVKVEVKWSRLAFRATKNIEVHDGSHKLHNSLPNTVVLDNLYMRHYSIRSFEQFERKIRLGVQAGKLNPNPVSHHWKEWYNSGDLRKVYDSFLVDSFVPES